MAFLVDLFNEKDSASNSKFLLSKPIMRFVDKDFW